ncbi:MAG: hypothetical protein CM15mP120_29190 [Pseudomonadota bacterium]|nr:MAG: hypothetical protein CM15mP120_29190 [Pseudomonadota bacterium]
MVNLADLYRATGRDELAGSLLATALERVPENAEVLVAKALWLVARVSVRLVRKCWSEPMPVNLPKCGLSLWGGLLSH